MAAYLMALDKGSEWAGELSNCRRARVVCSESSKMTAYRRFMAWALRYSPFFCTEPAPALAALTPAPP